ncbi:hypothetical protein [Deinococcus radiophilus]|uniref:DUF4352 domain-containing protein n=1 Tax=Deinococcus radiophilus TaxID=32062 RepID=A0A3S0KKC2_9DEIO|nr:hypothetical protein [Deinococcus radiophilus]RTR28608.1 hypothetical protein EJ104_04430 [Deinococcus radiophilus]UFA51030.1 hypothetical protein LMT64_03790 [Deinococcus radiophilus]
MNAKAALTLVAGILTLSACGSVSGGAPTAGELLRAPTSLNLAGHTLRAEATPLLRGDQLNAQLAVRSSGSVLPLNVHSVYLVTQGGVWQSGANWKAGCGQSCRLVQGTGPAQGLRSGENVQVVLRLQDSAGRNFWLRDEQARVLGN